MGKSKFIGKMEEMFGMKKEKDLSKKESIEKLLQKLKKREESLKKELKQCKDCREKSELKDSLQIIKKQIKKGEALL